MNQKTGKGNRRGQIILILILALQMAAAFSFFAQKTGFHYDEYYSYYSSNMTYGLVPTDREWKDGAEIRSEFEVREGEAFRYPLVVQMQTYDVHPPFYYLLLHTACSLAPGSFTKWPGLILNLICFLLAYALLAGLSWRVSRGRWSAVIGTCLLFGFCPAVLSGMMMARMYMLLAVLCLLAAWLHAGAVSTFGAGNGSAAKAVSTSGMVTTSGAVSAAGAGGAAGEAVTSGASGGKRKFLSFYLPLMITVYLGFLTHYYYVVFLFFLASGMEVYLFTRGWGTPGFWKKNLKECMVYGCSVVTALFLAVLSYPACLSHIFRGYRGTEAMGEFFNLGNTMGRIRFFAGLLNEYVFGNALPFVLLLFVGLILWLNLKRRYQKKGKGLLAAWARRNPAFLLMSWTAAGYFLVVAKTALLNAEEANRYQLPVYGFLLMLVMTGLLLLLRTLFGEKRAAAFLLAAACLLCLGELRGLTQGKVLFLYQEDAPNIEFAREHASDAVIYFYNPNLKWMIWDDSLELMQYDEIYFVNMEDTSALSDERLAEADHIWIYAARNEQTEAALRAAEACNPSLSKPEEVRELLYCDLYEMK